jgi:D-alanyl-D-alanine carboxypeptidase (penicillin-binding protein 5/6)
VYTYSRQRSSISPLLVIGPVAVLVILAAAQLLRGVPTVPATVTFPETTPLGERLQVQLPAGGSSAVSVAGLGQLATGGTTAPKPIASVTKMMTAYVVLKDHPLKPAEAGPSITTTAADAEHYAQAIAQDQSALPVSPGTVFTEYQLLEGMLVPSANNFAEILAAWDAGSIATFVAKMNAEAKALGMASTNYADVSGFSAASVSTAQDQMLLARTVMQNQVFAEIVAKQQVTVPGVGVVSNVNELLGEDGVVGIKTGYTEEAGGNLAFAARKDVGGLQVDIIGAVLNQVNRPAAFTAAKLLIGQIAQTLQYARVVPSGQTVATIKPDWADEIDVVTAQDVQMLYWPGMVVQAAVEIDPLKAPVGKDDQIGFLTLKLGEQEQRVPLKLARDLPKAGIVWKLTRI